MPDSWTTTGQPNEEPGIYRLSDFADALIWDDKMLRRSPSAIRSRRVQAIIWLGQNGDVSAIEQRARRAIGKRGALILPAHYSMPPLALWEYAGLMSELFAVYRYKGREA